ncbi:methionine/alanine import family NSS transporter small subunit [Demequina sp. NBRC 110057]|uniref:methionine/alanine import family NSS transporter small subunit n=1 Tax=Demequina sp. NBRC 110057 TaxID=1570346 RepID=UPI0009FD542B|nr:methionine/alanine import family NSS transporter small subunit [Demequina sp. NBRC 110057]
MSGEAIALMVVSMIVIWGGLAAAIVFLARQPEREDLPEGGEDEHLSAPPAE